RKRRLRDLGTERRPVDDPFTQRTVHDPPAPVRLPVPVEVLGREHAQARRDQVRGETPAGSAPFHHGVTDVEVVRGGLTRQRLDALQRVPRWRTVVDARVVVISESDAILRGEVKKGGKRLDGRGELGTDVLELKPVVARL